MRLSHIFFPTCGVPEYGMPEISVREETIERLDQLQVDDESYDEIITELLNIYEATELTLFHSGDEI